MLVIPAKAEEHTPLGEHMEALNDAFKAFRRETDPAKGAKLAHEAQTEALKAALEIPKKVKAMPDGPEKVKATVAYRKAVAKMVVVLCDIEDAFLAGKIEDVTKMIETLKSAKKEGHDQFMDEEE